MDTDTGSHKSIPPNGRRSSGILKPPKSPNRGALVDITTVDITKNLNTQRRTSRVSFAETLTQVKEFVVNTSGNQESPTDKVSTSPPVSTSEITGLENLLHAPIQLTDDQLVNMHNVTTYSGLDIKLASFASDDRELSTLDKSFATFTDNPDSPGFTEFEQTQHLGDDMSLDVSSCSSFNNTIKVVPTIDVSPLLDVSSCSSFNNTNKVVPTIDVHNFLQSVNGAEMTGKKLIDIQQFLMKVNSVQNQAAIQDVNSTSKEAAIGQFSETVYLHTDMSLTQDTTQNNIEWDKTEHTTPQLIRSERLLISNTSDDSIHAGSVQLKEAQATTLHGGALDKECPFHMSVCDVKGDVTGEHFIDMSMGDLEDSVFSLSKEDRMDFDKCATLTCFITSKLDSLDVSLGTLEKRLGESSPTAIHHLTVPEFQFSTEHAPLQSESVMNSPAASRGSAMTGANTDAQYNQMPSAEKRKMDGSCNSNKLPQDLECLPPKLHAMAGVDDCPTVLSQLQLSHSKFDDTLEEEHKKPPETMDELYHMVGIKPYGLKKRNSSVISPIEAVDMTSVSAVLENSLKAPIAEIYQWAKEQHDTKIEDMKKSIKETESDFLKRHSDLWLDESSIRKVRVLNTVAMNEAKTAWKKGQTSIIKACVTETKKQTEILKNYQKQFDKSQLNLDNIEERLLQYDRMLDKRAEDRRAVKQSLDKKQQLLEECAEKEKKCHDLESERQKLSVTVQKMEEKNEYAKRELEQKKTTDFKTKFSYILTEHLAEKMCPFKVLVYNSKHWKLHFMIYYSDFMELKAYFSIQADGQYSKVPYSIELKSCVQTPYDEVCSKVRLTHELFLSIFTPEVLKCSTEEQLKALVVHLSTTADDAVDFLKDLEGVNENSQFHSPTVDFQNKRVITRCFDDKFLCSFEVIVQINHFEPFEVMFDVKPHFFQRETSASQLTAELMSMLQRLDKSRKLFFKRLWDSIDTFILQKRQEYCT